MSLLQVEIDQKLKSTIKKKAKTYGISTSALIRILLIKVFTEDNKSGNIFNANRDNNGTGLDIDNLISAL